MHLSFKFSDIDYNYFDVGKPEPQPKKDAKPDTSGTKKKVQIVEPNKGDSISIDSKKNEDSSDDDDDEDEESTDDEVPL